MPTYEYRCRKCKKVFEVQQNMSAPRLRRCIHCKGGVERLIGSGAGLIFKGSGFYITDYKKKTAAPTKDTKPKTEAKALSSPEAKPSTLSGKPKTSS